MPADQAVKFSHDRIAIYRLKGILIQEEMTAIRSKLESRIILDFSNGKYSKNKIKQALRQCEVINILEGEDNNEWLVYDNQIKVGMYTIVLHLPLDCPSTYNKLKDYGDFEITIFDTSYRENSINLRKDSRFRDQYWVSHNFFGKLRIKHLVDIISHCKRLDKLKAFL